MEPPAHALNHGPAIADLAFIAGAPCRLFHCLPVRKFRLRLLLSQQLRTISEWDIPVPEAPLGVTVPPGRFHRYVSPGAKSGAGNDCTGVLKARSGAWRSF